MKTIAAVGKKRLSVTGRQLCVGSGIKSSASPIARAICFSEDAELLPDNESVSESNKHACSQVQLKGGEQTKACYQSDASLCGSEAANVARLPKFSDILSFLASWLKSAVQKSPEGFDYQQAWAGSSSAPA